MGMASGSALRSRVLAILGSRSDRVEPGMFVILGVLVALSCVMFFIATAAAAPPNAARSWVLRSAAAAGRPVLANASGDSLDATGLGEHSAEPITLVAARVHDGDDDEEEADYSEAGDDSGDNDDAAGEEDAVGSEVEVDVADADHSDDVEEDVEENVDEPEEPELDEPEMDDSDEGGTDESDDMAHMPVVAPAPPQPPRIVVRQRRMIVRVPAVAAVRVPGQPARNIVVNVPEIRTPHSSVPARRIVVRVPAVPAVHVPGQPARNIVVNIPVVRAVPAVPAVPARPARPARPAIPAVPATPTVAPAPPEPPAPPESVE
jgi:hypothetical protein